MCSKQYIILQVVFKAVMEDYGLSRPTFFRSQLGCICSVSIHGNFFPLSSDHMMCSFKFLIIIFPRAFIHNTCK